MKELMKEYLDIEREIKVLKERQEAIKEQLKSVMKPGESYEEGGYKATWSQYDKTTLDQKAMKAAKPEIVAEFMRTTLAERFVVR